MGHTSHSPISGASIKKSSFENILELSALNALKSSNFWNISQEIGTNEQNKDIF